MMSGRRSQREWSGGEVTLCTVRWYCPAAFLQRTIVVLEVILLGVKVAPRRIEDGAIGREGKGGNVVINIEQRLCEIGALRASRRQRAAANYGAKERAQISHPAKAANGAGAGHGVGWGAVYVWQQGSRAGVNSVTSTRVSSGS